MGGSMCLVRVFGVHGLYISVKWWFCQDRLPVFNQISAICIMGYSL